MTEYPFDLGPWSRAITTNSPAAQTWFDRGLNWIYGYNHEEAVRCFRRALEADPNCAMAWWGIAYAVGPFYNRAWAKYTPKEIERELPVCYQAAQSALGLCETGSAAEQLLIRAIVKRYAAPDERELETLERWHWEFTDAMAEVHQAHPEDLDIAALYAEAAVTCTVRKLWNMQTGEMCPNSRTPEAMAALEQAFSVCAQKGVDHPGVLHMHIHAMEMSHDPESAIHSADALRGFAPDAGHLEHMPAHIYVICGDYEQAVTQSVKAVAADDKYLAHAGGGEFYTTAICHDLHLYMFSAMFLGRKKTAFYAVDRILDLANDDLIADSAPYMASLLDTYGAMNVHVRVRFGLWEELTRNPWRPDPAVRPIGAAMALYGAGVAHSALGEVTEAEAAQVGFRKAVAALPEEMILLSNSAQTVLMVGDAMLDGELKYRKGEYDAAFDALRLAVARDDALNYTEPWAWMHPPRHALGALLAEQGHFDEAEQVFRTDMGMMPGLARCCHHPDNVWALKGLLHCVGQRDADAEEVNDLRGRLSIAEKRADVEIKAACCCAAQNDEKTETVQVLHVPSTTSPYILSQRAGAEQEAAMTTITVCNTCRQAHRKELKDEPSCGETLLAEIRAVATDVTVREVSCLMGCERACNVAISDHGKLTYVLGKFEPTKDAAEAIVEYAQGHAASDSGAVPFRQWPQGVKGHFIARVPPLTE